MEDKNPKVEDQNPKVEDKNTKLKDKNPKVEDKNPKIEDKNPIFSLQTFPKHVQNSKLFPNMRISGRNAKLFTPVEISCIVVMTKSILDLLSILV